MGKKSALDLEQNLLVEKTLQCALSKVLLRVKKIFHLQPEMNWKSNVSFFLSFSSIYIEEERYRLALLGLKGFRNIK